MKEWGESENLTLNNQELSNCRPVKGAGGSALRAYCPFHGSDKQRSLRIDLKTGRFQCFACEAWGYMEWARDSYLEEKKERERRFPKSKQLKENIFRENLREIEVFEKKEGSAFWQGNSPFTKECESRLGEKGEKRLKEKLSKYQDNFTGSLGEKYLRYRGIEPSLAVRYGVGYAPPGKWLQDRGGFHWGRVVFPHTNPEGDLVSLYGRCIEVSFPASKAKRHRHLSGEKGYFNASVIKDGMGPLIVCEGVFDALSFLAAGLTRTIAIFGVHGWRWEWMKEVDEFLFAMDADLAGQSWKKLARVALMKGKQVHFLPESSYGVEKDPSAAWSAGLLQIDKL